MELLRRSAGRNKQTDVATPGPHGLGDTDGGTNMNGRRTSPHDSHVRLLGLDVPVRHWPHKIALAVIVAGLLTVPLIPFTESPTSILARWVGSLYVALIVLANVILVCFISKDCPSTYHRANREQGGIGSLHRFRSWGSVHGFSRRFRSGPSPIALADLMVLIAAIGVGVALVTSFLSDTHSLPPVDREWGWRQLEGVYASVLVLMALTLGLTLT